MMLLACTRARGELRSRSRFFSLRISSHAPLPRTAPRSAQRVMRNLDQALCGYFTGSLLLLSSEFVSPGGKWAVGFDQTLRQGGREEARQHPRFGGRALPGRQGVQVEQGFEPPK